MRLPSAWPRGRAHACGYAHAVSDPVRRLARRLGTSVRQLPWRSTLLVLAQTAVLAGCLVLVGARDGSRVLPAIAAAVVVAGSCLALPAKRWVLRRLPYALDLPGAPAEEPPRRFSTRVWTVVALLATAAFVLLSAAGAPGWAFL